MIEKAKKNSWFILIFCLLYWNNALCDKREILHQIWGTPAPASLYLGMWTCHVYDLDDHLYSNDLFAFVYSGFFVGTFINCYKDRCFSVGTQRYCLNTTFCNCVESHFGYRLGLLSGYDERFSGLAGKTPAFPYLQLIYDINWKNIGFELSTTGLIISGGFFIQF